MSSPDVTLSKHSGRARGAFSLEKWLLRRLLHTTGPVPIQIAMKDGPVVSPPGVDPLATVVIRGLPTLCQLMADPEMTFGEAYADGRIEVTGDLAGALEAIYRVRARSSSSIYERLTSKFLDWLQDNSPDGSRDNIHRHYDLGNDFYELWLDPQLVYTCAYFASPEDSLEEAQRAKLDYICRKLRLQHGERVVEAGCGWGALALHMAENYGVSVRAFNISHEQITWARRQAASRSLSHRVEFIEDDYRSINGKYDVFVSVGMLEHVGAAHFAEFGRIIHRAIGDTGRGLLHFIGRSYKGEFSRWIRKRIFPGAYAPTLQEVIGVLQPHRFAVLDVENLRLHYARTLECWLERFERVAAQVSARCDPWFTRAWRLYLAGSMAAFRAGTLQLFQITFGGPESKQIYWTRAPLYASARHSAVNRPVEASTWKPATS
jgi:cyclopropane-fatty-acyl-phospholipid synthase